MQIGEELIGYVIGTEPSLQNADVKNLIMRKLTGETVRVYTAGNLRYIVADGKVKEGMLTKITRIADKMVKGKNSSQFNVEQDDEQLIENYNFPEVAQQPAGTTSQAPARNAVADRARELANQAKAKRA